MGVNIADVWCMNMNIIPGHLECIQKQGKSEGLDSCDRPSILTQIWYRLSRQIFSLCDLEIWRMT